MSEVNLHAVERYQRILAKDPNSELFAPLADAYRKLGMLDEARQVAESGLKSNPNLAGGRVALAQIYGELNLINEAVIQCEHAITLSPDNVLAHNLKAEYLLRANKPKEALKAYKTLLFFMPDNERAITAIKKLESLTADEYDSEVFSMQPLKEVVKKWESDLEIEDSADRKLRERRYLLDRALSLADAYLARHETDKALKVLNDAEAALSADPEILKRLKIIHERNLSTLSFPKTSAEIRSPIVRPIDDSLKKIDLLKKLRNRFESKRFTSRDPSGS